MLSASSIKNDIEYIRKILDTSDCSVPTLWDTFKPALALIIVNVSLQTLLAVEGILVDGLNLLSIFPSIFTLFFSFIVSVGITDLRAKYLSLPVRIRQESILVKFIVQKIKIYAIVLGVAVFTSWFVILIFDFPPFSFYAFQFMLTVTLSFIFSADMSRYQLTALRAIIVAWGEGQLTLK